MERRGIDISYCQGAPDFAKLKGKVDFIILQAGFGRYAWQKDEQFERNYSECKKHGIPVGAYWFSYAATPTEARTEAITCMDVIAGKQFEYPIYFDIEEAALAGDVSGKCKAFCSELEKNGYFTGIYMSRSPAQQYLSAEICRKYALWLAELGGALNWNGEPVGMWQDSWTGRFGGIAGDVDTDICYVDYPALIKKGGYNGFPKSKPTEYLDEPDEAWWRMGDKDKGIYAVKQRLKAKGHRYLDDTGGFGGGTEKAVNSLLAEWGYVETGVIGKNFVDKVMK